MIKDLVHHCYWDKDLNCARTTLKCLNETCRIDFGQQVFEAAVGLHGAGGFRAQCGLVEGTLLFIGLYGHKIGKDEKEMVEACFNFASEFERRFGSLRCRELRPNGFSANDPPHACEALSVNAIEFAEAFISENLSWR